MVPEPEQHEEELLRSVAIQNAQAILAARQRAEQELVAAKEALEARTVELERANALIRTIAENAASCLLMLDENGVATYMNPAAVQQTGYLLDEFSRGPFHEVLHAGADKGGHRSEECPIRLARERMEPLRDHHDLFVRRDGTSFPVSCSVAPFEREGRAAGAVLEFRDISAELAAQKALQDASRQKDEFLATLSHELRTPMTAVLGWAKMLELGLSEEDSRQAIAAIVNSAEVQAQLIDDVLDVSRIVAGKMTYTPMPVDVSAVVHAAMTTIHPAAAARGIEVMASIPPRLPPILGDEGRLQQIVWNLLANAVKFTPRGGTITIRLSASGSKLRLIVHDTGRGIQPEYLPHIFEPFTQEDSSMTRAHEGIGLGLSIVRSLVELHGGRVRVASEGAGRGSTFTVELPAMDHAPLGAGSTLAAQRLSVRSAERRLPALRGVRVLVIDDQELTRDLVTAVFRRAEAEVGAASSVREGVAEFNTLSPHVVVCDLAMPQEDGYAFLRTIRALPPPANATPIVALTAFGRPEDRRHALAAGFNEYLKKPIDPSELTQTVLRFTAPTG
ncbi:MAG TPA: ATP-binding protein [Thermoanaerobaculia bacterium]|jgi:PAS domain S-box-containing protein